VTKTHEDFFDDLWADAETNAHSGTVEYAARIVACRSSARRWPMTGATGWMLARMSRMAGCWQGCREPAVKRPPPVQTIVVVHRDETAADPEPLILEAKPEEPDGA
jgi:hypothetical protein